MHLREDVRRVRGGAARDRKHHQASHKEPHAPCATTSTAPASRSTGRAASGCRRTRTPIIPSEIRGSYGSPLKSGKRDSKITPATVTTIAPSNVPSYSTLIIGGIESSGLPPWTSGYAI